jgi:phosphatidylglycerol:prolipoprotein diacylglycerol transferase
METLLLPFPNMDPIALSIGPFFGIGPLQIRWYALAYIGGILIGWWLARRLIARDDLWSGRERPSPAELDDFVTWMTLAIIVGGRLGYVVFYNPLHYLSHPAEILMLWQGGMSFHGGVIGPIVAIIWFSWGRPFSLLSLADIVAAVAPVGLFFGRIANFINGELWGRVTTSPFGMIFPHSCVPGTECLPRHPSQIYEAALEGLILFLVLRILTHGFGALRHPGIVAGAFGIGYGFARISVEFFREVDDEVGFLWGGVSMGQVLSVPLVLAGLLLILLALFRMRRE